MKTKELEFDYPKNLVAKRPVFPRHRAKLLVVNRRNKKISVSSFWKITDFLKQSDLIVFNDSKVFLARVFLDRKRKKKEVLFLSEKSPMVWEIISQKKLKVGERLGFSKELYGKVIKKEAGTYLCRVNKRREKVFEILDRIGSVPLPPYLKRKANLFDKKRYQNFFAKPIGSAAAPTAGLHFSRRLLKKIEKAGVEVAYLTLHVGAGTFTPIRSEEVEKHQMHEEFFEISPETARSINKAKKEGRRIIACGTTCVRALESSFESERVSAGKFKTDLFIYPGYKFKVVDALITNFHTPKSSLLALVFAFGGKDLIKKAYRLAIKNNFRLFSYGDGMFIF